MNSALAIVFAAVAVLLAPSECAEKVQLGFYSESLCPDCIYYANFALDKAIKEVGEIFNLNYVPWGNAILKKDGKIECQHGKLECTLNTLEACMLHYHPTEAEFWPFLHCLDMSENPTVEKAKECIDQLSYNWTAIDTCTNGELGYKLDLMYYNETASLKPPHEYTPWITIDGKHDVQAEGSGVIEAICKAYKGQDKPKACDTL